MRSFYFFVQAGDAHVDSVHPEANENPADDGGIECSTQCTVQIIRVETRVSSFAGMQAFCEPWQHHKEDDENDKRE